MKLALLCIDTKTWLVRRYWRATSKVAGQPRRLDHGAAQIPEEFQTRMGERGPLGVLETFRLTGVVSPERTGPEVAEMA